MFPDVRDGESNVLADVPFGRNRVLAMLGGALIGLSVRMISPTAARGDHGPVPQWCYGYGVCHCCSGHTCCASGCSYSEWLGCPTGGQCWFVCDPNINRLYRCCDWQQADGGYCICMGLTGIPCDG